MSRKAATATVFIWIGFIGAISFMEAWLKFRAPGVTLPIGLSIGRLVFAALNKVEWVLLLGIGASLFPYQTSKRINSLFLIAVLVVIVQTIWLLPILDERAQLYITGASVRPSHVHLYYVIGEIVKMIALLSLGTALFKNAHD
ncbi:hypothetical protein [Pedobacter sp. JY14-1]|uniref:hypothetical protein n=1 Tax=Pedobacter sp. JY14-1 TaxID=3034151 RepID=UPI0023E091C8|nr:hypothetical protein [Pedobacter sp. JY14-1]